MNDDERLSTIAMRVACLASRFETEGAGSSMGAAGAASVIVETGAYQNALALAIFASARMRQTTV